MDIYLTILICLIWFGLGFVGFIIEAKKQNYKEFKGVKDEFLVCIFMGVVTFVVFIGMILYDWFDKGMNKLLYKINSKNNKK